MQAVVGPAEMAARTAGLAVRRSGPRRWRREDEAASSLRTRTRARVSTSEHRQKDYIEIYQEFYVGKDNVRYVDDMIRHNQYATKTRAK